MKKLISVIICLLLLFSLSVPVLSLSVPVMDEQAIIIVQQPQSPTYCQYSVAEYTVVAVGEYLRCTWYLEYNGETYNVSDLSSGMQPWEVYAGETYGALEPVVYQNEYTYTFYFGGIETGLDGAKLYAVIDNGHIEVISQKAYISVLEDCEEPPFVFVLASMEVFQGEILDLYCSATLNDGDSFSYLWFETPTGRYEDMIAVNRGSEMEDTLRVDTSYCRETYFVCEVTTSYGGITLSSPIKVSVIEDYDVDDIPIIETEFLEDGMVNKDYSFKLECNDDSAQWQIYYNPGRANDFEETGLTLNSDGRITGKPAKSGSFTFTVVAYNDNGEDYAEYTLIIAEDMPTSMELISPPDKLEYFVGETIDLTGLKVRIYENGHFFASSDGDKLTVSVETFEVAGTHVVRISYGEAYDYFMVEVKNEASGEISEETTEEISQETTEETIEESSEESTTEESKEISEEPSQENSDTTEENSQASKEETSNEQSKEVSKDDIDEDNDKKTEKGMPWWAVALIALASLGIGVGGTLLVLSKKK